MPNSKEMNPRRLQERLPPLHVKLYVSRIQSNCKISPLQRVWVIVS